MITYNYTSVVKRESKTYSFDNVKISSSGISGGILKTVGITLAIFNVIGIIICAVNRQVYYIPVIFGVSLEKSMIFLSIFVFLPAGIGVALKKCKIAEYDLITFLYLYLKPKPITDIYGKPTKITSNDVNGFVIRN